MVRQKSRKDTDDNMPVLH